MSELSVPDTPLGENYEYWRTYGEVWVQEYAYRKKKQVYYHLQELMLLDYMERNKPARVLDYGCGVGRHLRNLVGVPGIEVYGYDQSEAMVRGCLSWTTQEWINQHIRIGSPTGRLPYPDQYFDIVFTSEVLIHTSPDDLEKVLAELIRVSSWQILHFEPSYGTEIHRGAHNGSWSHDLVKSYNSLGVQCEVLPSGYASQSPYRVVLNTARPVSQWPISILNKLRSIETDLQPTILELEKEADQLASQLGDHQSNQQEIEQAKQAILQEAKELEAQKEIVRLQLIGMQEELNARDQEIEKLREELLMRSAHEKALEEELGGIQSSASFVLVQKIKTWFIAKYLDMLLNLLRGAKARINTWRFRRQNNAPRNVIRVFPSMQRNANSQGQEIWLLDIAGKAGESLLEEGRLKAAAGWKFVESRYTRSQKALLCQGSGWVDIPRAGVESLTFQTHPWSGIAQVVFDGQSLAVDLYNEQDGTVEVKLESRELIYGPSLAEMAENSNIEGHASPRRVISPSRFSDEDIQWLEKVKASGRPVAVLHPNWLGIRSSTRELFRETLELNDDLTEFSADYYARLLIESKTPAVVIQGFPLTYVYLLRALKKQSPHLPIYNIWHGNFMQTSEDYNWKSFQVAAQLCREGVIKKWGFVKKGMAETMARLGYRTGFVMNYANRIPQSPSVPEADGLHFGLWASSNTWRKLPYAMMASLVDFPGAKVFAAGHASERVNEFARLMGIKLAFHGSIIRQEEMPLYLAKMHLNLYITLSECTPMVPLESFSVGAPCLLGPNSHLFEDDEYLFSRLVVPFPERSDVISAYIRRALEEREELVLAYQRYAPNYNCKARQVIEEFLDGLTP